MANTARTYLLSPVSSVTRTCAPMGVLRRPQLCGVVSATANDDDADYTDANTVGQRRDHLKHIRRILLAERKRLEDRRAESFSDISAALHKMAQDELSFVKSVILRSTATSDDGEGDGDEGDDNVKSDSDDDGDDGGKGNYNGKRGSDGK